MYVTDCRVRLGKDRSMFQDYMKSFWAFVYTLWSWGSYRKLLGLRFTHKTKIIRRTTFRLPSSNTCIVLGKLSFNINVSYLYVMLTKPLILSTLHIYAHNNSMWKVLLSPLFHRKGNRVTKKWKDLTKVTLVNGAAGIWPRQSDFSFLLMLFYFLSSECCLEIVIISLSPDTVPLVFPRGPWEMTSRCAGTPIASYFPES